MTTALLLCGRRDATPFVGRARPDDHIPRSRRDKNARARSARAGLLVDREVARERCRCAHKLRWIYWAKRSFIWARNCSRRASLATMASRTTPFCWALKVAYSASQPSRTDLRAVA